MIIPKIIISIVLVVGFVLFALNIELFMPKPEEIVICGWFDICIPDIPANLAASADWTWRAVLITGITGLVTIITIAFIWFVGLPGKGGRFGHTSKGTFR